MANGEEDPVDGAGGGATSDGSGSGGGDGGGGGGDGGDGGSSDGSGGGGPDGPAAPPRHGEEEGRGDDPDASQEALLDHLGITEKAFPELAAAVIAHALRPRPPLPAAPAPPAWSSLG